MSNITEHIDVRVPVRTAYNQWTQFEEFPRFMKSVKSIRQLDDRRLLWRAEIGGRDKEWEAEIVEQIPDSRIAWRSRQGAENAGVVTFHRIDNETTRVTLQLDYDPEGALEAVGDTLGLARRAVTEDLERFKEFIEGRGQATGEWRGTVTASPQTRSVQAEPKRDL